MKSRTVTLAGLLLGAATLAAWATGPGSAGKPMTPSEWFEAPVRLKAGGEFIDVSAQAVLASRADCVLGRFITGEISPQNTRDDYDQQGPASFFECADGFVYLYMTNGSHWSGVKMLMGQPEWLDEFEDDWLEFSVTPDKVTRFQQGFAAWVRGLSKGAASEEAQRVGVPLVPVTSAADLKNAPQYRHRGFFRDVAHPALGSAAYPGVPYLMSASPARITSPLRSGSIAAFGSPRFFSASPQNM